MKRSIKNFLASVYIKSTSIHPINLVIFVFKLLFQAKDSGLFKSIRMNRPVNRMGKPMPWITHSCVNFLTSLDLSNFSMVEIGSGNSSFWFSTKVKEITSYESDHSWIKEVIELGYTGKIVHHKKDHIFSISELRADVILIDGHDRIGILETIVQGITLSELTPKLIIIDNSNWFPLAISSANNIIDYIRIDFIGTVSGFWSESMTSVLVSRKVDKEVFSGLKFFGFDSFSGKQLDGAIYDRPICIQD